MRTLSTNSTARMIFIIIIITLGYGYYYLHGTLKDYKNDIVKQVDLKKELYYLQLENQLLQKEIDLKSQKYDDYKDNFYTLEEVKNNLTKAFGVLPKFLPLSFVIKKITQSNINQFLLIVEINANDTATYTKAVKILSFLGELEFSKTNRNIVSIKHNAGIKK